jgi:cysteinyl-tRNA synthetase
MANVWMHNGFLQVEGEKMSKSLGNFVTINELLATDVFGGRSWPGEVLRLAMLRTHYRQPIDWTVRALEEAHKTWMRWRRAVRHVEATEASAEFLEALCDDLNLARAEAELHLLERSDCGALRASVEFLGITLPPIEGSEFVYEGPMISRAMSRETIDDKISDRTAARVAKNWAESDRIRDELAAMGIVLKDNKDGTTTWEVAR